MTLLNVCGLLLEFVGLAMTAVNLSWTWGKRVHPATPEMSGSGMGRLNLGAVAMPGPSTPVQEQIDALVKVVGAVNARAVRAEALAESLQIEVQEERSRVAASLQRLDAELKAWVHNQAAADVPWAAIGLGAATVGALLQFVAGLTSLAG